MTTYVFRSRRGAYLEKEMDPDTVPRIGEWIRHGRERFYRIPTMPQAACKADRHFVDHTLPRNWPYAKDFTPDGKPRFDSMAAVREAEARSQDAPHPADRMAYDQ